MKEFVWSDFYRITRNSAPWPRLVRAVSLLGHTGEALDLGCGAGRDTRYLLERGFSVTAVDREAASLATLADLRSDHLRLVQSAFEDFTFGQYDLINAHFALPFTHKEHFPLVFTRLKAALNPGGIFVGQFFGVNDSWNVPSNPMTFFSREQSQNQLEGLEILEFEEEDKDGATADDMPKHWHVYHIITRKP
jgi:tellurite methyltransferase